MPRALITGISGQDGSYLSERLVAGGWEVHGLIRAADELASAVTSRNPEVTLHEGDLRDTHRLGRLMREIEPDGVFNLAGISSVALSWQEPLATAEVTGLAVASMLDQVLSESQRRGVPIRILQASSAEIFGNADVVPQDETTPLRPTSPYGAAKAYAHHLVGVYRSRGLHAVGVILFNHESERRPTSFVTRKITSGVAEIAAGLRDEIVLGNLDSRRDWGWAPDYVDAMVKALAHPAPDDYVIATGVEHSVQDFLVAAFEHVRIEDWKRFVRTDPAFSRPADAAVLVGDAGKARRELGWAPTVSFQELVGRMVDKDLARLGKG